MVDNTNPRQNYNELPLPTHADVVVKHLQAAEKATRKDLSSRLAQNPFGNTYYSLLKFEIWSRERLAMLEEAEDFLSRDELITFVREFHERTIAALASVTPDHVLALKITRLFIDQFSGNTSQHQDARRLEKNLIFEGMPLREFVKEIERMIELLNPQNQNPREEAMLLLTELDIRLELI